MSKITVVKHQLVPPPEDFFTLSGFGALHASVLRNALRAELRLTSGPKYKEATEELLNALTEVS
jgi:hypothetical protein